VRNLPDPSARPVLTVREVHELLGIGINQCYAACERGDIPAIKIGSSWRIPTAKVLDMLGLSSEAAPTTAE
jgi:excisionase family DNA binding protein